VLPVNERLKTSREFTTIYNLKRSVANSLLILYVGRKKAEQSIPTKVGFVVGKKVHKRAVKRNRAKRLMREAYRNIRKTDEFLLKDYEYLIFLARPPILEADYKQVYDAVLDCFKKASKRFS
jgi:ribonuclease P protein component